MKKLIIILMIVLLLPMSALAAPIDYKTVNSTIAPIAFPEGYVPYYNPVYAEALAKMMYGEGGANMEEHAATSWVVINRVEAGYGSLLHVLSTKGQFVGYRKSNPVTPLLHALAVDILIRWDMERCGYQNVGRVLPKNYLWFSGSNGHNWFRDRFKGGTVWNFSWDSPYS